MARPDLSGTILDGRYRLDERLAEGGMGVVYRGVSLSVDRAVAVKLMHASLPGEMAARERFQREARLMALVDHPHCVSVIDSGLADGKPYLVMELVRGRSLAALLAEQQQVEIARATDIMCQILSGLAYAHEQGIIHRDIKPANVMITPKAPLGVHVRILDFGLARLRESNASLSQGLAVGTPSYMAPEQARGEVVDFHADLYACGVVFFEMLAGRKPFVADDQLDVIKQHIKDPPPRLAQVAGGEFGQLEAVVARALAKSAADRFPSAVAMSEAIDAAMGQRHAPETTATFAEVTDETLAKLDKLDQNASLALPITVGSSVIEPPPARRRARWPIVAALGGVAAAGAIMYATRTDRATPARAAAAALRDASAEPPKLAAADPPADPTAAIRADVADLVAKGGDHNLDQALARLAAARHAFPDRAVLPYLAGKIYFARFWFPDGVAAFRDAIKLDPAYKSDPELIKIVVRGFITTPEYDPRIGGLLAEIGDAAAAALDETARMHPNPQVRARAAAQLHHSTATPK